MSKTLLLVESPNKAKQFRKYLEGDGFVVEATVGHFCDLASDDLIDRAGWEEAYVIDPAKAARIASLRALIKSGAIARVLLASDPDREGEAIAWHAARELKAPKGVVVQRIEFHEVGKAALLAAIAAPRAINLPRVEAQRARRVLDRVLGYDVSGLVRRVNAKSAGRVQTPALHILCARERAILAFVSVDYWTIAATYTVTTDAGQPLVAQLTDVGTLLPLAVRDIRDAVVDAQDTTEAEAASHATGSRTKAVRLGTKLEADTAVAALRSRPHVVRASTTKPSLRKPFAPYTTTTFAADAFRKFGIRTERTMALAQKGFEAGLWTYHRTDSVHLSAGAIEMLRDRIASKHPDLLPATPPTYASAAGAQEAHEALRITGFDVNAARFMEAFGADAEDGRRLWLMIAARCLASQCVPAAFDKTLIEVGAGDATLVAEGSVLTRLGFLTYWGEYAEVEATLLPRVTAGDALAVTEIAAPAKRTLPPARYDEASFNTKVERSGIGRPSTLASILKTLRARGYITDVKLGKKTVLQPTELGLNVDAVLTDAFPVLVLPEYTRQMEAALDSIAEARLGRVAYLREHFYPEFSREMDAARGLIETFATAHGIQAQAGPGSNAPRPRIGKSCPQCSAAELVEVRFTPKGQKTEKKFIACEARCGFTQDKKTAKWRVGACVAPACGGTLIERDKKDKSGTYWRCARCSAFAAAPTSAALVVRRVP